MENVYGRKIIFPGCDPEKPLYLLDCFVYVSVDPSGGASEETATARTDKAGWAVQAVDVKDRRFVLELQEKHLTDAQFVDLLFELRRKYLPKVIGVEKTPHLLSHIRNAERDRKEMLPLMELKPRGRKKSDRIRSGGAALDRTYFLNSISGRVQNLFRNWYDEMEHGDDGIDAFAYLEDFAKAPTEEQIKRHREEIIKAVDVVYLTTLPRHVQEEWKFLKKYTEDPEDPARDWEDFVNGR